MSSYPARIFISEIPLEWTKEDITQMCNKFGTINNVVVVHEDCGVRELLITYAVVEFDQLVGAYTAIRTLHDTNYNGITLRVSWAFPVTPGKSESQSLPPTNNTMVSTHSSNSNNVVQLLVSFKSKQAMYVSPPVMIKNIKQWFSLIGIVETVNVQKFETNTKQQLYGFAFVCYAQNWIGMTSAIDAVAYYNKKDVGEFQIDTKFAAEYIRFLKQHSLNFPDLFRENESNNKNPQTNTTQYKPPLRNNNSTGNFGANYNNSGITRNSLSSNDVSNVRSNNTGRQQFGDFADDWFGLNDNIGNNSNNSRFQFRNNNNDIQMWNNNDTRLNITQSNNFNSGSTDFRLNSANDPSNYFGNDMFSKH